MQDFLEDAGPLESLQLDGSALGGVLQVFNSYVNLLMRALPSSSETEESLEGSGSKIVRIAETESQQLALLANASLLADDLLPYAAMKLLPLPPRMDEQPERSSERQSRLPEQREWKKKLQRSVDRLRDSFFDDQTFWEEIEEGPKSLGALGLQQLYLDMEFVLLFLSQGRYLSRNLHQVIKNIIAIAIDSVAASGVDPYSTLLEDDWFAEVAQIAFKMLTGKANLEMWNEMVLALLLRCQQNLYLQSYLMVVTRIQPLMSTESSSLKKRLVIHQLPALLAVDLFARCYHRWNKQYTAKPLTEAF